MNNTARQWMPLAVAITVLSASLSVGIQQAYRLSANDPQIQMAEDGARAISRGEAPASVVPREKIDVAHSLAPFLTVFSASGEAMASSGFLHDRMPTLPDGVLQYVRLHGEDRITWQPEPGVRAAIVVVPMPDGKGCVMAGRSLRETEQREHLTLQLAFIGWCVALAGSFAAAYVVNAVGGERREDAKVTRRTP